MKVYPLIQFEGFALGQAQAAAYFKAACPLEGTVESRDGDLSTYNTPAADSAPWFDGTDASEQFLGAWVDTVSGIDVPTATRGSSGLVSGGSVPGAWSTTGRGIVVSGLLYALNDDAMAVGQRWLTRAVLRASETAYVWVGAPDDAASVRVLFGVAAVEPPRFAAVDGIDPGLVAEFTVSLVASDPHLYAAESVPVVSTGDGGTAIADPSPACPPVEAPFTVDCAPLAPLSLLPFGAAYDDFGRPSCGPGSAGYLSGVEVPWVDQQGRPSSGEGSGQYLAGVPGTWVFDRFGRPSCGEGSGDYGAERATVDDTITFGDSDQITSAYESATGSATGFTRQHTPLGSLNLTVSLANGAHVRLVTAQWTIRNPYGTPTDTVLGVIEVEPGTIAAAPAAINTVTLGVFIPVIPLGLSADLVVAWEQFIPDTGLVVVSLAVPGVAAVDSPNGGSQPTVDEQGRPSCGPGSGHYRDVELVEDGEGRPSCGDGSGMYLADADPDTDPQGRPSCGPGSGLYLSQPGLPAPDTLAMLREGTSAAGDVAFDFPVNACAVLGGLQARAVAYHLNITNVLVSYTYGTQSGGMSTTSAYLAYSLQNGAPPFEVWVPGLPADAAGYGPVTVHMTANIADPGIGGPVSWALGLWVGPCGAYLGPNGGVDVDCSLGPNGGVDRDCAGPNGGEDISCDGSAIDCEQCTPGPNGGTDRNPVDACVSLDTICPTSFEGGWPGLWATADLPHPGEADCVLPALCIPGQDRLEGLASPTGRVPWTIGWYNGDDAATLPCDGSTLIAVRIRATLQTPTGTGARWTFQAVDQRLRASYGGYIDSTVEVAGVEVSFAVNVTTLDELANLIILGDLAAPRDGVEGWVDNVRLEVQYTGGEGCLDCGPNDDDVDCAASSPLAGCWTDPEAITVYASTYAGGTNPGPDWVPFVAASAGDAPAKFTRVRWYAPIDGADGDTDWATYHCTAPLAVLEIPEIPSGWTMELDGRARSALMTAGGAIVDAGPYVTGLHGAPWIWPAFTDEVVVIIETDDANPADVAVEAFQREVAPA